MSTVSKASLTSFPDVINLHILSFLEIDEVVKSTDKISKVFHQLSSHDFFWRPLTLSISDNISREKDPGSVYPTYQIGKNRLSTFLICDKLKLPFLTQMKIRNLQLELVCHFLTPVSVPKIMCITTDPFEKWSPAQHNHIQMLSSVLQKVMEKNDPSEIEIMKSCLLDGTESCVQRQYVEVRRLFLAFVAPRPYMFNWIPFCISQNAKQITLREIVPPELLEEPEYAPVPKKVICSTWKQVYKSAMQHFLLPNP
jgi:hypothetical protein